jgi:hypothetical protein
MRRLTKAAAALAFTAAAVAGPLAVSAHAGSPSHQHGLVNVYVEDVLNGNQVTLLNNVAVDLAATVCGVDVDVLTQELATHDRAVCPSKSNDRQQAWVKKNR